VFDKVAVGMSVCGRLETYFNNGTTSKTRIGLNCTIVEHLPDHTDHDWQPEKWRVPTIEDCSAKVRRKLRLRDDTQAPWQERELYLVWVIADGFYAAKEDGSAVYWIYCEILDEPETDNDGWIEWHGGERPVGRLTNVMVKYRDGIRETHQASLFFWDHKNTPKDIIAYRVVARMVK
jgi:hypothetical protein